MLSKIVDAICFIIGSFLTVVSILSYKYYPLSYGGGVGGYYYYSIESKIGIGVGIALICVGFLRKHWGKKALSEGEKEKEDT